MGICSCLVWLNPVYVAVTASAFVPALASLYFLSFVGIGAEAFVFLNDRAWASGGLMVFALVLYTFMFLFEAHNWRGYLLHIVYIVLTMLSSLCLGLSLLLMIKTYPQAPFLLVVMLTPSWLWFVQSLTSKVTRQPHSLIAMRNGLYLCSVAMLGAWIFWAASGGHWWTPAAKATYAASIGCKTDFCTVQPGWQYPADTQGLVLPLAGAVASADACCDACQAHARQNATEPCTHWTFASRSDGAAATTECALKGTALLSGRRVVPLGAAVAASGAANFTSGTVSVRGQRSATAETEVCREVFVLYISPLLLAAMNLVLGILAQAAVDGQPPVPPGAGSGGEQLEAQQESRRGGSLVKLTTYTLLALVIGVYFNTVVSVGSAKVAGIINAVIILCFCILGTIVAATSKWPALREKVLEVPLLKKLSGSVFSIWLKAFFVLFAMPPFAVFSAFAYFNHLCRKHFPCMFGHVDDRNEMMGTQKWSAADDFTLSAMGQWPWNTVLRCAIVVGIALMALQVVIGKAVTLFLAWLNAYLSLGYSTNEVIVIFFAIGLIMFLLPPVPGVPVYLAGGVILTNALQKDYDFWVAGFLASCICFAIKLVAIVAQQKGIGELCGKFVAVRSAVSINSMLMRAIKRILSGPVDFASVCILCGGPDWPTSVTTGILGLSLCQMLKGSLPVFFVILPTCMAGALQLRAAEGGSWAAMAATMLTCCGMMQTGAGLMAMHFIESCIAENEAELKAEPDDEKVKMIELLGAARQAEKDRVTAWDGVPAFQKCILVVGAVLMSASIYTIYFAPLECFKAFEVTGSIDADLGGDPLNIVLPRGWFALQLCLVSYMCMWMNGRWVSSQMRTFDKLPKKEKIARAEALAADCATPAVAARKIASMEKTKKLGKSRSFKNPFNIMKQHKETEKGAEGVPKKDGAVAVGKKSKKGSTKVVV
jgi:hypothetical protein